MRRRALVFGVVLVIGMVAGAGYLGLQSVQGKDTPGLETPSTVEVTRGDVQTTVTAPGHLLNTREALLAFGVSGKLAQVCVQPGLKVSAGEVLAQLDQAPLLENVMIAQANLDAAQARVDQLQAGPSPAEWAAARLALVSAEARLRELIAGPTAAEISAAEAEVATTRNELQHLRSLPDPSALIQAQAQLDKAAAALQQAQAAYDQVAGMPNIGMLPQSLALQQATIDYQEKARAELAQLAAGSSAADRRQAEAARQLADLSLSKVQAELEAATLVAPFDGIVLEVRAGPGEMIAAATGLILLADDSRLEVEATVIEEDLPLVQVGQLVELFFDSQPEVQVQSSVARIVPQRLPGDRPLFSVYVTIADPPRGLVAGMTADASIVVDSRQDVLRLPRVLVAARADGTATVQVWTGSEAVERTLQVGLRGDVYVEILGGIDEGEKVVAQ
jgi:HlyD family secretion protein